MPVTAAENDEIATMKNDLNAKITEYSLKINKLKSLVRTLDDIHEVEQETMDPITKKIITTKREIKDKNLGSKMKDGRRVEIFNAAKTQVQTELA